ncbi:flagellar hook-length control protein FliK [Marinobacter sp. CHS3-4]|uniref:flagellar hook-length control protein FliK n=1 Tax=Marinobacter sp. CHS3-4 TaxID=3045174 RepID=UPI0024B56064|nr:flagellar hook-length control protein FliK [Marinobacter sp. CHS3-4]MDI9245879.1 flagellar hook-length control protein FliK [Marinobacter sp. CHS3-4]
MKLPNGNPPPPQSTDRSSQAKPTSGPVKGVAQSLETGSANPATSAKAQLAQLKLANRETTLARVAEIINQQSSGTSRLLLDVRGQTLPVNAAIGDTSLETGDWVKVMRAGNELRLLGKLAATAESTVSRALAQRLPWQQSIDSGLAKVLSALTTGVSPEQAASTNKAEASSLPLARLTQQPLPAPVRQAIEQLVQLLPNRQALSGLAGAEMGSKPQNPLGTGSYTSLASGSKQAATQQIQQWIERSGLFAESRTARAPEAPPSDLKLAIGRIIHQLLEHQGQPANSFNRITPIPTPDLVQSPLQFPAPSASQSPQTSSEPASVGQMLRLLAGVLNRITVNQLHSQVLSTRTTADAPAPNNTLVMDLPWLNQNNEPRVMQLRIEEQASQDESTDKARSRNTEWKLSLAMNLDESGPMHFDVSLGQGQVSAQVWAERQSTLQQAREQLPELRKSFANLGLEVVDLECRRGIPQGATTHLEHRLVDTRA